MPRSTRPGQPLSHPSPTTQEAAAEPQAPSVAGQLLAAQITQTTSGPIPSAAELARYEQVRPGLADKIIDRFEKQSDHRMELEKMAVRGENLRATGGLIAGFVISVSSIASSFYLIMHGHDVAGSVLGGTTLVSLVGTFIYGSKTRAEERIQKTKLLTGTKEPKSED